MLEHGAEINARNNQGKTPLHSSIKDGYYVVQPMDKYDVVFLLLENGANANIQDNDGNTPLHFELMDTGDEKIVRQLTLHGADLKIKNKDGLTPKDIAMKKGLKRVFLQKP